MRKLLTIFITTLLAYAVGFDVGWAAEKTAKLEMNKAQTSPVTVNGVTFTWTSSNIVIDSKTSSGFKANSNMTVTLPSGAKLTKIEKTNGNTWGSGAAIAVYAGSDNKGTQIASIVSGTNSYTISANNTGGTFYFANSTSKNAWVNTLTITYDDSSSSGGGDESGSDSGVMTYTPSSASAGTLSNAPASSVTAAISGFSGFTSGQGAQRTTADSPATITFSNLPTNYKVTKIEVKYCTNSSKGQGTISATLNGSAIGSSFTVSKPSSGGTTVKSTTLYENSTGTVFNGNLVVSTAVTENSVYIYQVLVTYKKVEAAGAYSVVKGTITGSGDITFSRETGNANDEVTVTATPETGWELTALTANGTDILSTKSFKFVDQNVTVSATFSKVKYNIYRTITTNGESITAGGWLGDWTGYADEPNATDATDYTVNANYGSTVTFKAGTNDGYQVGTVTAVDGNGKTVTLTEVSSDDTGTTYSFTMPATTVTITANFLTYHPTLRLAGRFNGNTSWRTTKEVCPEFTYDGTSDKYTIDAYFTGEGEGNYFFLLADETAKHPSASGNWVVNNTTGTATELTWNDSGSANFQIESGVYTIELKGDLSTIAFTRKDVSLAFSPAAGDVDKGQSVSATSNLGDLITAIKAGDTGAAGDVSVQVSTDNSTWASAVTLNTVQDGVTVYGRAAIGNYATTATALYNVKKVNTSNKFQRITSTNDLIVGKKYLLVCEAGNYAWAGTGDDGADITITNNETTLASGSTVNVLTLQGTEGAYYFTYQNNGSTYYLAFKDTGNNSVSGTTTESSKATWAITFSDGNATIASGNSLLRAYSTGKDFRIYTSTSNQTVQLYAQVSQGEYSVTYNQEEGKGTISGKTDANEGDEIVVSTSGTGYVCTSISVSPSTPVTDNHDGTFTFTMPASDVTVTPTWEQAIAITYVSKYIDNSGEEQTGTTGGTVSGPASAVESSTVAFTVTPASDYQLKSVTYAWASGSRDITGDANFTMPATETTVTAVFEKKPFSITVVSANGQVNGVPATATSGTTVAFTVTPQAGYTVTSVTATWSEGEGDDATTGSVTVSESDGTYSFSMPGHNVTLTVGYFAGDEYQLLDNVKDIVEGDTYLIVGGAASGDYTKDNVMSNTKGDSRLTAIALTSSNYNSETGIISSTDEMSIVKFVAGTGDNAGKWAIYNESLSEYLYATKSGSLLYESTPSHYATITVDGTDHNRAHLSVDDFKLSYNYNSGRSMFRFYSTEQGATYIFKLANQNKVKRPSITGAVDSYLGLYNFIGTEEVTLDCATEDATIEYKIGDATEWTTYTGAFSLPQTALGGTVTVTARATHATLDASDEVTATFTCIAPTWHTKPCGDNWDCTDVEFNNPMFIYPIGSLANRNAYGKENIRFFYTLDGTTPTLESTEVLTPSSGEKFLFLDSDVTLTIIPVINDIAGDPVSGKITFKPAAPTFSLTAGTYDGDQQTRISTETKSQQNGTSWTTQIWYALETTSTTPEAFAFNAETGEVTSAGWQLYEAGSNPYIDILVTNGELQEIRAVTLANFYGAEFTGAYSGASRVLNGTWKASDESTAQYELTAANLDVVFTPAGGTYLYEKDVTLTPLNGIGTVTIHYTTDGSAATAASPVYSGAIHVGAGTTTISVYAEDERMAAEGKTYTKSHTYNVGVQAPEFSPIPGDYYKGDDKDVTAELFSVTSNAKIYYTTDGSEPTTSSTLYTGDIPLSQGTTTIKAVAFVGGQLSAVSTGTYTVSAKVSGNYWYSIKEMNEETVHTTQKTLANPVQVVYMSTWRNGGEKPEYAFVRDNSGYGLIYFGNSNVTSYNSYTKFQSGDWLAGGTITGKATVWDNSYINELGNSSGAVTAWPSTKLGNTPIVPENTTNKAITDGWTYEGSYSGTDYASYVDKDKNLFGHYVHMRKNTITDVSIGNATTTPAKYIGIIKDESGVPLNYYDGFYLFSNFGNNKNYDQEYFDAIQNKGGTFAIYGMVYFYGKNANNAKYSNAPYEIFPIDFDYIYPPIFHLAGDPSASDMTNHEPTRDLNEPTTLTLSCDTRGAQIWYKTSDMEDFAIYDGSEIAINKSMTIETYSTHSTEHFDELVSVTRTLTITLGDVPQPVISPESTMRAIDGEPVDATIGFEDGAQVPDEVVIYFTVDNSDPADKANENRYEYTAENIAAYLTGISTTTTVRAIAMVYNADFDRNYYSEEADQRTYTFVKSNGIVYTLVTGEDELDENSVYVVVNKEYAMSMQRTQKDNNRDDAPVLFVDDTKTKVYGNDDLAVFTMRKVGSKWYFHTANGSNNASTGFLYGAVSGSTNQLRTNTITDPSGVTNIEWTIEIGNEGAATMYNVFNGNPRYLRYNKTFDLFNSYSSESTGQAVYLYKKEAMPLANIEKMGTKGTTYTVADELVVVAAHEQLIWVKDQGNVSIARTEIKDGQIDYMRDVATSGEYAINNEDPTTVLKQEDEWDQSNWAVIDLSNLGKTTEEVKAYVGSFIAPATLNVTYTDNVNYAFEIKAGTDLNTTSAGDDVYTPNVYCAANFLDGNLNLTEESKGAVSLENGKAYFFMNPKVQEVFTVTYAVWDGTKFNLPEKVGYKMNGANLSGAFAVDYSYNSSAAPSLKEGEAYQFTAVLNKVTTGGAGAPKRISGTSDAAQSDIVVKPLNLTGGSGQIVTEIDDVNVASREVVGVTYYNVAGQASDKPFEGVNIVVTRYSDGSTTSAKQLR